MKACKNIYLVALLCLVIPVLNAQTTLGFTYDNAGNMIERKLLVFPQGRIGKFTVTKDSVPEFKVYPNPTSQFITIEGELPDGNESGEISIVAINGQVVRKDNYTGQGKSIPVSDLKPGMYLMEIRYSKENASVYKIIISN